MIGRNIVMNQSQIDLTNAGFIDGEYTAGASSNFMTKFRFTAELKTF
jgi:hypothetical protein